jgi:hypothetical protein
LVNALVFNGKAVVERRGFRPKIFDEFEDDPYLSGCYESIKETLEAGIKEALL